MPKKKIEEPKLLTPRQGLIHKRLFTVITYYDKEHPSVSDYELKDDKGSSVIIKLPALFREGDKVLITLQVVDEI
jgi:hypothetical protein